MGERAPNKRVAILGTRGIPARYRGFESFAEALARYLVARGWDVTVYCQDDEGKQVAESTWEGIRLVSIPAPGSGSLASIFFDWRSIRHAARQRQVMLTLGYNTAFFCVVHRLRRRPNVINMDGIEWQRGKWPAPVRAWFWVNERLACWLGNHLIADHPGIADHLATRVRREKITMIPYGADRVTAADPALLEPYGLSPGGYALIVGMPQPDNSTLEMVRAFSRRRRGIVLAVLCPYDPEHESYHRRVMDAAGPEVRFLGGVYDRPTVRALQFHCRLYLHGHQVGGTNPSLLEALGSGCAIVCHDNRFTRWVAGDAACYFADEDSCARQIDRLLDAPDEAARLRSAAAERQAERFTWEGVLAGYESLLLRYAAPP